jgi:RNA-directed DNA polymerase
MPEDASVNIDAALRTPIASWKRVLEIQTKLHRWAGEDKSRRFDDVFNLVYDPVFLAVAWDRVRNNRGARTAGVDGASVASIEARQGGAAWFLTNVHVLVKTGTFSPRPVRERMIPKAGGKLRRLGIPTVLDRVVQAALKLVLEPIFEADFVPCSYGFRPNRRAQDAIQEIHLFTHKGYEWVLDADIEACFDRIDHTALMDRVRARISDKRVLALVKSFLKAGILTELGNEERTLTGTPQGGILSPLLANIALSVLDEYYRDTWPRTWGLRNGRRKRGQPTWRLVRYADDFVALVNGTREHTETLRHEIASVLAPMGLRLSEAKTQVVHLDEGFDFLGWRIQRHRKRGADQYYVYTYPAKKALASVVGKIRAETHKDKHRHLSSLLIRVNQIMKGWAFYFRHGVSQAVFGYLRYFSWRRLCLWLRKHHKGLSWRKLHPRAFRGATKWEITANGIVLFDPTSIPSKRYRYRGTNIPTPWTSAAA